ncbi:39S ribosomal protein L1, mitochondrial-like [Argiope bruennichi]|uniref:39S ribosomal protein L1, mitochondrial-like n=1 Tax=Argiope bruennichi TaxID=94029 RepID=UPI0024959C99|nr:39S ribosomal protein L1, mitochondrial-like [Argiope bruennichi]
MFTKTLFPVFVNYSVKVLQINTLGSKYNKINAAPSLDIVRYAARKGTRAAALAKKKAQKLAQQNKPEPIPKHLQRKVRVSIELERKRCTDENWLDTQPTDNVWNMKLFRGKPYPFAEAIKMHRDAHVPEMLNDPSALVYANIELDLNLKKKNRYIEDITGILSFPHEFKTVRKNRIAVICKNPDDQAAATDAGASYAGSATLVKQILAGSVSKEDFDFLICHPDMLKEVNALRGILAKKFPNTRNGLLRLDIAEAVKSFLNGVEYNLKRSNLEIDFGWVDIPFGRLDMPIEQLEENFRFALNSVEQQKPPNAKSILFILRTLLFCENSRERFKIPHWDYLPNYPVNGVLREEVEEGEVQDEETVKTAQKEESAQQ